MGGREDQGYKVYVGNCEGVPEEELRDEFSKYGGVENVWIARNPPGFAFVWYRDERDAQGACAAMDGKSLAGKNLRVEMSKGRPRNNDRFRRGGPPRKTGFKIRINNLPEGTQWTELKDFVRKVGEVIYANVNGDEGVAEFADRGDMERASRELDGADFGSSQIRVTMQDESDRFPPDTGRGGGGGYDRSPPRGGGYDRSPPRRGGYDRSPPRRRSRSRSPRGGGGGRPRSYSPRRRSPPRHRSRSPRGRY